jgi:hypothetical protein
MMMCESRDSARIETIVAVVEDDDLARITKSSRRRRQLAREYLGDVYVL